MPRIVEDGPGEVGVEFPAEHWKHLRTTNPIESAFATVRLRQRVTRGAGNPVSFRG